MYSFRARLQYVGLGSTVSEVFHAVQVFQHIPFQSKNAEDGMESAVSIPNFVVIVRKPIVCVPLWTEILLKRATLWLPYTVSQKNRIAPGPHVQRLYLHTLMVYH